MIDAPTNDLVALSRAVSAVDARLAAGAPDPFSRHRHVSVQATFHELRAGDPPAHERPLREALARWVHELLQLRVGWELALAEREAESRVDERLPRALREVPAAPVDEADVTLGPARTFAEARAALHAATTEIDVAEALGRLAELAAPVGAVRNERRSVRAEIARRLGLAHPWSLACDVDAVAKAARVFLAETDGIAEEVRSRAEARTASQVVVMAHARDAAEGWPAHLGARWLEDVFAALQPRRFAVPRLPRVLGGASFLRAAYVFGHALRTSGTARSLPFVLARDPYAADAHRFGALFAGAVGAPAFQRRKLGLSPRATSRQVRALDGSLLHAARVQAVKVLLAHEPADVAAFEELTLRAFGGPLPRALGDAWPTPRIDEPLRFVGVLEAPLFARDLVARFDEDWFDNPRAGGHLASLASGPMVVPAAPDEAPDHEGAARALARAFEQRLG